MCFPSRCFSFCSHSSLSAAVSWISWCCVNWQFYVVLRSPAYRGMHLLLVPSEGCVCFWSLALLQDSPSLEAKFSSLSRKYPKAVSSSPWQDCTLTVQTWVGLDIAVTTRYKRGVFSVPHPRVWLGKGMKSIQGPSPRFIWRSWEKHRLIWSGSVGNEWIFHF